MGQDLGGIIGILIVVPVYMIIKIVVTRVYQLFFKEKWEKLELRNELNVKVKPLRTGIRS